MKSLVVGAMLLQRMNAQLVPAAGGADTAAAAVPASVLTPGINAPSDANLALGATDVILPLRVLPALPTATADVVLDEPTPVAPFGGDSTPGTGISFGPKGWNVPNADVGPAIVAPQVPDLAASPTAITAQGSAGAVVGSTAQVFAIPIAGQAQEAAPADPADPVASTTAADPAVVDPAVPDPATPFVTPVILDNAAPVEEFPSVTPIAAFPSVIASPPQGIGLPFGSSPNSPYEPNSVYDPTSPYYDPYAQPPGWEGDDNGIYDGEDDDTYQGGKRGGKPPVKQPGYDDEECPSWCLPEDDSYDPYPTSTPDYDYSPYQPTPTPEYPDYEPATDPYQEYDQTSAYIPYPKVYPTPSTKYAADPYEPYPTPTPDYEADPQYYPDPEDKSYPQLKKVRSILRAVRRQVFNWPQPSYAQPSYSDDDDSGDYDGEDGSIPDWLYDISGAPQKPTPAPKPKCPKSCYKPKPSGDGYGTKPVRPTYTYTRKGGYKTSEDPYQTTEDPYQMTEQPYQTTEDPYQTTEDPYYPEPTTDGYYGDTTTSAWYPQGNSSGMYWPTGPTNVPDEPTSVPDEPTSIPDEPTSVPSEPTAAPYEPTTLATYYQPQPYPAQTGGGGSDPGSPAGDYTGDTLDTLCPNTCNPFNPAENFCDITTGCATTGGSKYYCACRAGFRADNYNAKDFSKQFKVAGQPYVYLAVSTSCNTPCSDSTCSEVLERSQCK